MVSCKIQKIVVILLICYVTLSLCMSVWVYKVTVEPLKQRYQLIKRQSADSHPRHENITHDDMMYWQAIQHQNPEPFKQTLFASAVPNVRIQSLKVTPIKMQTHWRSQQITVQVVGSFYVVMRWLTRLVNWHQVFSINGLAFKVQRHADVLLIVHLTVWYAKGARI